MKRAHVDDLDAFRKQMFRDVKDLHIYHKLVRAVELITKDIPSMAQKHFIVQRGKLAQFGLETSVEEKDDLDLVFQEMWKQDVNRMRLLENDIKQELAETVTYAVSWTQEELSELRMYIAQLREVEKGFAINKKMMQAMPKIDAWTQHVNDVAYIKKQREMEQNYALTNTKKELFPATNNNMLEQWDQHIASLREKEKAAASSNNLVREWPVDAKPHSGFFHICGIANVDVDMTWARLVAVCTRLGSDVTLRLEMCQEDVEQEIYFDLELEDFFEVATQIARHLDYKKHYLQYYFQDDPRHVVAHAAYPYVRAWPMQNGIAQNSGYFVLDMNDEDATSVWEKLETLLAHYPGVCMHEQASPRRVFVYCTKKQFLKISAKVRTGLSYTNIITYT